MSSFYLDKRLGVGLLDHTVSVRLTSAETTSQSPAGLSHLTSAPRDGSDRSVSPPVLHVTDSFLMSKLVWSKAHHQEREKVTDRMGGKVFKFYI